MVSESGPPIASRYQDAELNHLRDALEMDVAQRWAWLQEAMDYGFAMAQQLFHLSKLPKPKGGGSTFGQCQTA